MAPWHSQTRPTWGSNLFLIQSGWSTLFLLKIMASDSEVLILIPVAANYTSASWKSPADKGNRVTSSAKSRKEMLQPPKWRPSLTWPRNFVTDSVHNVYRQRAALQESNTNKNDYELLLPVWTKLSLWFYSNLMGCNNGADTPYFQSSPTGSPEEFALQVHNVHVDWLGKFPSTFNILQKIKSC